MEALQIIRPELLSFSQEQMQALLPYFWVSLGAAVAILGCVVKRFSPKWPVFLLCVLTCGVGICASITIFSATISGDARIPALFNGMMVSDAYANFFNVLFLASAGLTALASFRYLDREKMQHPEYYVLLLFSALGMMLMTASTDLMILFIALELMSLSVYVLVGFRRIDKKSNEAAMKYFILGSAASAFLLYGTALLYGATGATELRAIYEFLQSDASRFTPMSVLAIGMVVFGFMFKIASVPFHMWMPDVYEGAPAPITGFMTTGLKAAAFGAFFRVFFALGLGGKVSAELGARIYDLLWISAVLTMVVGNLVALAQINLKRMLAYSSIAHTGYLLIGILSGSLSDFGFSPAVLYLVAYSVMNLGAFGVLTILAEQGDTGLNLNDLSGVARRHPWLSFAMAVFLFSLAGIPPTAGFAAKYLLFYSAVQAHQIPLVIIGVLCSAVSMYYYLRVLVFMYMREPMGSAPLMRVSLWSGVAVTAMVLLTLQMGILPGQWMELARKAIAGM